MDVTFPSESAVVRPSGRRERHGFTRCVSVQEQVGAYTSSGQVHDTLASKRNRVPHQRRESWCEKSESLPEGLFPSCRSSSVSNTSIRFSSFSTILTSVCRSASVSSAVPLRSLACDEFGDALLRVSVLSAQRRTISPAASRHTMRTRRTFIRSSLAVSTGFLRGEWS